MDNISKFSFHKIKRKLKGTVFWNTECATNELFCAAFDGCAVAKASHKLNCQFYNNAIEKTHSSNEIIAVMCYNNKQYTLVSSSCCLIQRMRGSCMLTRAHHKNALGKEANIHPETFSAFLRSTV